MAKPIKIRAKSINKNIEIRTLIAHTMETGFRKDAKTGKKIPAHFIKEVICEHNGKVVLEAKWGVAVSRNPYLSFKLKNGVKGDRIKISWLDNKGGNASSEVKAK